MNSIAFHVFSIVYYFFFFFNFINYYKTNDFVYEHNNWVIYNILFLEELKPNLNLQSKSVWVCNACFFFYHQRHHKQWKLK